MKKCTIRSHADLRHRNTATDIVDLPESLQVAYQDAVKRDCGCAIAPRLARVKADDEEKKPTADEE